MRELYARFSKTIPEENVEDESTQRERAVAARKALQDVPRSFFADDASFELQNASSAFASNSSLDDAERTKQLDEAQAHLDAVEGALVAQLRDSSDDFFDALGDFRALWGKFRAPVFR